MGTIVTVRLAEAPTDVLVWLVDRAYQPYRVADVAKAVAPADADAPLSSTRAALELLDTAGYVVKVNDSLWAASAEGVIAVRQARDKDRYPQASGGDDD